MRPCSRNSKHKKLSDKMDKVKKDMISALPDELIVLILSLLTISEAARTSVLSRRWEKLWNFYSGSLIFDFDVMKFPVSNGEREYGDREMTNFIDWVNQVLFSLAGSNSVEFTVRYNFREEDRCHIDRWVEFALDRQIERLELDMRSMLCPYTFPIQFWTRVKQPRGGLDCISALTSLILKQVDISGGQVEYFLSSCPLLENLCIAFSKQLLNLKVAGTKLRLKNLQITYCFYMKSLEISAPNLLSLEYYGPFIKLRVENVPQLVKVFVGHQGLNDLVASLSSYFSQLETLQLTIDIEAQPKIMQHIQLIKLKHLILSFLYKYDKIVSGWTSLIKASPLLHKLTFKLRNTDGNWRKAPMMVGCEYPHKCLKVVEMVGFTGCPADAKLLMSIANSNALEKLIIDCRDPLFIGTQFDDGTLIEEGVKKCALRLKEKLPSGIDVIVV